MQKKTRKERPRKKDHQIFLTLILILFWPSLYKMHTLTDVIPRTFNLYNLGKTTSAKFRQNFGTRFFVVLWSSRPQIDQHSHADAIPRTFNLGKKALKFGTEISLLGVPFATLLPKTYHARNENHVLWKRVFDRNLLFQNARQLRASMRGHCGRRCPKSVNS